MSPMQSQQTSLTGTESDDEFNELAVTPEDESDDDSIAPDEDAADEEEIDSLVKESNMSLEDLLASYGVSTSATDFPMAEKMVGSPVECSLSTSRAGRRRTVRRLATAESKVDEHDSAEPTPSKVAKCSPQSHALQSPPPNVSNLTLCPEGLPEPNSTSDSNAQPNEPSRLFESNLTLNSRSVAPSRRVRSRSLSLTDFHYHGSDTPDARSKPYRSSPKARSASFEEGMLLQLGDSQTSATTVSSTTDNGGGASSTSRTDASSGQSLSGPLDDDYEEVEDKNDADDETGDEEKDQHGLYSARFWQRAVSDGESTPSYNSDEDEDYAPSEARDLGWKGEIRVGDEFQAHVPSTVLVPQSNIPTECESDRPDREDGRLWQPDRLAEDKVIHYERLFAQTVMYSLSNGRTVDDEQALFLLMRCEYDPNEALERLKNKPVHPLELPGYLETWTDADSLAFEKGFAVFGKDFRMIRESRLRHKTVGELVHYYYVWKKTARHDEFARVYRRDKKKPLHPGITDFMDCFAMEQDVLTESYLGNMKYSVSFANSDDFSLSQRHSAVNQQDHFGRRVYSQFRKPQTDKSSSASHTAPSVRSPARSADLKQTLHTEGGMKVMSDIVATGSGGNTPRSSTIGSTVSVDA